KRTIKKGAGFMKVLMVVVVLAIFLVTLKISSPKPVVVDNILLYQCDRTSPLIAVANHFNNFFQTALVNEYEVTGLKDKTLTISGFTWWGIEITRAEY